MAMRFPEKNSRGEQILKAFIAGPMTIWQGAEAHGEFANRKWPQGIDHAKMVELYCDLVERECLFREGILYRLSEHAKNHLQKLALAAVDAPRTLVPPRIRDWLSKPLFLGYSPFSPRRLSV